MLRISLHGALPALLALAATVPAGADSRPVPPPASASLSYADLADLADQTPMVIRAQPRKIVAVEPERARGVRAGWGRFYVEARTEAVIAGTQPLGQQVKYLVDLPLDPKGKPPQIKKKSVVLFVRTVPGRPGELQLVRPDAQLLWDAPLDARLRGVITELYAPSAPHRVTGVREAIHVGGDLAGEGESQLFLSTANGEPAAITVSRRPGAEPRWAVSFSEVVAGDAAAPARDTLAWYRLACFLPAQLPAAANISPTATDRTAAARDYRFVMEQLGPCPRSRN
ncbi:MAG: hypothetical protein GXC70_10620 [Sphingomonadaceae bacterium]|nr:hypothetical protein [Sphingomonadaceae bacterium]